MSATASRSPDWFLDEVVQPTLDDFLPHRDCIRRGMLAALAVSSLADHIGVARSARSETQNAQPAGVGLTTEDAKSLRRGVMAFRRALAERCPEFALVRDAADATKHVRLDRPGARTKDVSGIQLHVEPITGRDGSPILFRDSSVLATGGVVVVLPDGSRHPLAKLLNGAVAFLRKERGR